MQEPLIPDRASGRYAQQYAGSIDPQRLVQIFTDSATIALQSKDPDTAAARRDLSLEAYHQLRVMHAHQAVHDTFVAMIVAFPTRVRLNEAVGLVSKAAKLKTTKRKADLLRQALGVLHVSSGMPAPDAECQRLAQSIAADLTILDGSK